MPSNVLGGVSPIFALTLMVPLHSLPLKIFDVYAMCATPDHRSLNLTYVASNGYSLVILNIKRDISAIIPPFVGLLCLGTSPSLSPLPIYSPTPFRPSPDHKSYPLPCLLILCFLGLPLIFLLCLLGRPRHRLLHLHLPVI
ncbi:hypothetical protein U1Q18_052385 [Sarracenia purpurea var. burkii]